jgi:NADPH:quinone reductase-like Zn-dependent oxidoreductase
MRAVQILGDVSSPRIVTTSTLPKPTVKNSEILIKVLAAGVTGDEVLWPELYAAPSRIPGHDISGIVCALGPEYSGPLQLGQDVAALIGADRGEGQAEYAVCLPDEVAPKPKAISHAEASALPIPLLTAWQAVVDHGQVKSGMKVLVTGASGAVGSMAVQLINGMIGASVVALASSRHHETVKQLGAQDVVDYADPGWESSVMNIDVVLDTVGGDILTKAWATLKEEATIITVGDPAPSWAFGRGEAEEAIRHPRVQFKHFIVKPDAETLEAAFGMIDEGHVKPLTIVPFPFDKASEAWEHARQRGRRGKVVIEF